MTKRTYGKDKPGMGAKEKRMLREKRKNSSKILERKWREMPKMKEKVIQVSTPKGKRKNSCYERKE